MDRIFVLKNLDSIIAKLEPRQCLSLVGPLLLQYANDQGNPGARARDHY